MTLAAIIAILAPLFQGVLSGSLKPRVAVEQLVSILLGLVGVQVTPQGLDGILTFLEKHAGAAPKTTEEIIDWFEANGFSLPLQADGSAVLHQDRQEDPTP